MNCPKCEMIMSFDGEKHECESCGYSQGGNVKTIQIPDFETVKKLLNGQEGFYQPAWKFVTGKNLTELRTNMRCLVGEGYSVVDEIPFTMVVPGEYWDEHHKRCLDKARKYGLDVDKNWAILEIEPTLKAGDEVEFEYAPVCPHCKGEHKLTHSCLSVCKGTGVSQAEIFCKSCGGELVKNIYTEINQTFAECKQCKLKKALLPLVVEDNERVLEEIAFPRKFLKVKLTEDEFQVEMLGDGEYVRAIRGPSSMEDLAKLFNQTSGELFKELDKKYDLSTEKRFNIMRWDRVIGGGKRNK